MTDALAAAAAGSALVSAAERSAVAAGSALVSAAGRVAVCSGPVAVVAVPAVAVPPAVGCAVVAVCLDPAAVAGCALVGPSLVARVSSSPAALASQIWLVSRPADPVVGKPGQRFREAQTELPCL